ncbi:MAG: ATP-binding cassette domain-containing protein [Mesotoga sp.]|uniref:ABC transporter ATP-binding protein/permease n=1 Tax=unclassified Mesotoga TaxID=1184398 RepID=UPI000EF18A89|nr:MULTISPECIES: ABC transporter ATP-binding protein/permease [unclassified Mesotoga]MDI9367111.1 ATP-binding cassette domain-containing protein [Thermotogota bacterium]MDD2334389.1 ATP-binding cassette domain-containing protein [Mesotoga sp.]MDD3680721.1 ATP-binding cassette domain-containing protein [Mesotoga sp.]MDD4207394.1 ATP-binding cassette domain-containing protein [Mesotoga sp.]MDD4825807.1 ATP-binding cassette domain-containing protein [Mesotoga sp.]
MLQLEKVSKIYETGEFVQTALNEVSICFSKNEFVAILGPSGSGKTTLLNIIGGLDRCYHGDLVINGKSAEEFTDWELDAYRNKSIGFVFQSFNLIPHLSILDNIQMGMILGGVHPLERNKKAMNLLEGVGLSDQANKKPNQLSNGQMQRVAIARALANNPDIVLADEPTGSLDSQTGEQTIELIREMAVNKLVIMVTHNEEIAKRFADRVIILRDGYIASDNRVVNEPDPRSELEIKKTRMSYPTALKLSATNILTKKWRTALTVLASSIGIVGIFLVLSLSSGFGRQLADFESQTLSTFPIMVSQTTVDIDSRNFQRFESEMSLSDAEELFIYPYDTSDEVLIHNNNLSDEYLEYVESINPKLLSGFTYTRHVNMNLVAGYGEMAKTIDQTHVNFTSYPENLDSESPGYLESNFDLVAGSFPKKPTDLVMIVKQDNRVSKGILQALGVDYDRGIIAVEDIVGLKIKAISNNDFYVKDGMRFSPKSSMSDLMELYYGEVGILLEISGIIRAKEQIKFSVLNEGLAYSDRLAKMFIEDAMKSEIVKAQKEFYVNILTGEQFASDLFNVLSVIPPDITSRLIGGITLPVTKRNTLQKLGAFETPVSVVLYPKDFKSKQKVLEYLDAWNEGKSDEETVIYIDLASTITRLLDGVLSASTIVLLAFALISLAVSLIMIGIITYISVTERTKEIGILRALGARKIDVTRVFNAENFIIGTFSGILGIFIASLLILPMNSIIERMTGLPDVAYLNPLIALGLAGASVILTILGGLIPAKMAARKDPVEALRSE